MFLCYTKHATFGLFRFRRLVIRAVSAVPAIRLAQKRLIPVRTDVLRRLLIFLVLVTLVPVERQ